jgi:hypothetical protein
MMVARFVVQSYNLYLQLSLSFMVPPCECCQDHGFNRCLHNPKWYIETPSIPRHSDSRNLVLKIHSKCIKANTLRVDHSRMRKLWHFGLATVFACVLPAAILIQHSCKTHYLSTLLAFNVILIAVIRISPLGAVATGATRNQLAFELEGFPSAGP